MNYSRMSMIFFSILIFTSARAPVDLDKKFDDLDRRIEDKFSDIDAQYDEACRKIDERFSEVLRGTWVNVETKDSPDLYEDPKPDKLPSLDQRPKIVHSTPEASFLFRVLFSEDGVLFGDDLEEGDDIANLDELANIFTPEKPRTVMRDLPPVKRSTEYIPEKIDFYGLTLDVPIPDQLPDLLIGKPSDSSIADWFDQAATFGWARTMDSLTNIKNNALQGDWAYLLFLDCLADNVYPDNKNSNTLLQWYFYNRTGYKVKLVYTERKIFLLFEYEHELYGTSYFTFGNGKFYLIDPRGKDDLNGSCYTYDGDYPGARKMLNLSMNRWPLFNYPLKEKEVRFEYESRSYKVVYKYQPMLAVFLEHHPQAEIGIYAKSPMYRETFDSLVNGIAPLIKGKSEVDAVNILLAFVQTAFNYKTDDRQFGREKWLFPEETLHYPASDCEDRAALFGFLVKNLLGLPVAMLDYPGHMAAAVKFSGHVQGDSVDYRGQTWTVCDPTYINASAGMAMPSLKSVRPTVHGL